jgi:hypothetical protein
MKEGYHKRIWSSETSGQYSSRSIMKLSISGFSTIGHILTSWPVDCNCLQRSIGKYGRIRSQAFAICHLDLADVAGERTSFLRRINFSKHSCVVTFSNSSHPSIWFCNSIGCRKGGSLGALEKCRLVSAGRLTGGTSLKL